MCMVQVVIEPNLVLQVKSVKQRKEKREFKKKEKEGGYHVNKNTPGNKTDKAYIRAVRAPCSPARSHTRHIRRRLALSSAPTAAVLSPTPVNELCFPLQLKFTSL